MRQETKLKIAEDIKRLSDSQLQNLLENARQNQPIEMFLMNYEEASKRGLYLSDEVEKVASETKHLEAYYYARGSESVGPMTFVKLLELYETNYINAKTLVWTQGFADWTGLDKVNLVYIEEMRVPTPPPIQPQQSSYTQTFANGQSANSQGAQQQNSYTQTSPNGQRTYGQGAQQQNVYGQGTYQQNAQPAYQNQYQSSEKVNNVFVWLLAFAPLISFIVAITLLITVPSLMDTSLWYIGLIVNILFFTLDIKVVRKAGYTNKDVNAWFIVLVPLYLFSRAKALKENNGYAIVWCVLYGINFLVSLM